MRHVAGFASYILIILGLTIIGFSIPSEPYYYKKTYAYEPLPIIKTIISAPEPEIEDKDLFDHTKPNCSCIIYLQTKGFDIRRDAKDLEPNYFEDPQKGDIVLLTYPKAYHVAYIEEVYPGGMWVSEANYKQCQYTERLIEWSDPAIRGYLRI